MSPVRQVTKKCYWADQGLEAWSHEQKRHPERAADDNDFIEQRVQAAVRAETERLLSFVIGVSFGRWDLAVTNREISLLRYVLAPLPNLQPACLGHENAGA